ncbi:uncharacterized protein LOC129728230 [Wyeomyia smithii]|uniref:uncharacterized protein LOC129728230 n=1 Tax=Wyeomyia smithii TaxID=174621 RepID=UPI002467F8D0|nr:uncharacterized protein LOC129728230 [Wyeomyia smithii]
MSCMFPSRLENGCPRSTNTSIYYSLDIEPLKGLLPLNPTGKSRVSEAQQNLTAGETRLSDCLAEAPSQLEQIARDSFANTKQCFDYLVARLKLVRSNVKEHIEFFVGKVHEIQQIGDTCVAENPNLLDQVLCVLDHISESNAIVLEIIQDAGDLLAETIKESVSLATDTKGCLLDVVRQTHNDLGKLVTDVHQCLHQEQSK